MRRIAQRVTQRTVLQSAGSMAKTCSMVMAVAALAAGCSQVLSFKDPTIDNTKSDAGVTFDAAAVGPDADLSGDATVVTQTALFGTKIGAPVGNIGIISTSPNNTVLATGMTDANGNATIKVYPGGSVTAVYKHTVNMGADLITWVGVKPGDTLTFGNRLPSTVGQPNPTLGVVNYSWPALTGATSYIVVSSCILMNPNPVTATTLTATESSLCHRDPMDVLFLAFGANGLMGYSFRSNVTFSDGVAVAGPAWTTTLSTAMVNITGLPPDVTSVSGSFETILDSNINQEINETGGSFAGNPTGGAFSASFSWHSTGERTLGQVVVSRPAVSQVEILDSFSTSTLTQTIAAPTFPPRLQSSTIASSALQMASWFLVPDASSTYDGQLLHLNWSHVASGTSQPHQWDFILPPGPTSIEFPALPAQFNDAMPQPVDIIAASTRVFDISSVSSYDMLRTQPSANIMCLQCAVVAGDFQHVVTSP